MQPKESAKPANKTTRGRLAGPGAVSRASCQKNCRPGPRIKLLALIFFSLSLAACATSNNRNQSNWFSHDKFKHFAASAAFSGAIAHQAKNNNTPCDAAVIGFSTTILIGAGKEIYDKHYRPTGYSYRDMVWNIAGATTGSLLASDC